jgi:hypothetical protein
MDSAANNLHALLQIAKEQEKYQYRHGTAGTYRSAKASLPSPTDSHAQQGCPAEQHNVEP